MMIIAVGSSARNLVANCVKVVEAYSIWSRYACFSLTSDVCGCPLAWKIYGGCGSRKCMNTNLGAVDCACSISPVAILLMVCNWYSCRDASVLLSTCKTRLILQHQMASQYRSWFFYWSLKKQLSNISKFCRLSHSFYRIQMHVNI